MNLNFQRAVGMRRVPWRLAAYFLDTGDERVKPALQALAAFFEGQAEVQAETLTHLKCTASAATAFLETVCWLCR
jgi:hypothetical protein